VPTELERLPHVLLRWIKGDDQAVENLPNRGEVIIARDSHDAWVALFGSTFLLKHYTEKYPDLQFVDVAGNK
jgi:peptide subunit release factor RF-3